MLSSVIRAAVFRLMLWLVRLLRLMLRLVRLSSVSRAAVFRLILWLVRLLSLMLQLVGQPIRTILVLSVQPTLILSLILRHGGQLSTWETPFSFKKLSPAPVRYQAALVALALKSHTFTRGPTSLKVRCFWRVLPEAHVYVYVHHLQHK